MRKMLCLLAIAGVAAASASAVSVSPVRAGPIPGGWRISYAVEPSYLSTSGLTSLGCPFVQHDYGEGAYGFTVTASLKGWEGPIDQVTFLQQVDLRAHATGTLKDVAGNIYAVNGNFTERKTIDSLSSFDIVFDGPGKLRLSGPAGSVVGQAQFYWVTAADSFSFTFTSITQCTIS